MEPQPVLFLRVNNDELVAFKSIISAKWIVRQAFVLGEEMILPNDPDFLKASRREKGEIAVSVPALMLTVESSSDGENDVVVLFGGQGIMIWHELLRLTYDTNDVIPFDRAEIIDIRDKEIAELRSRGYEISGY